jgi:hypothetical protein
MPRREYTTEIKDDYGDGHVYTLIQHPADEGFDLLTKILKIIAPSVGAIMDSLKREGDAEELSLLDSDIDAGKLGAAIGELSDAIVSAGGVDFCKRLLKHTTRVDSEGTEQKVAIHFSKIYQGNYAEMGKAVWFAVEKNFVPSLSAGSEGGSITDKIALLTRRSG